MNLKQILAGLEKIKAKGEIDREITTIENDSRNVVEGSMFFAIKGFTLDGTQFIPSAIEKGAKVIVVDETTDFKSLSIPEDVTLIVVPEIRESMAICACNFYDNPSRKFKLVGITGTKGKTTTTYMIKAILEKQGIKTGLVGTIATYIGNEMLRENTRTTPESIELQKEFAQMAEQGCKVVVMEVSSQSLKLHRVTGCQFDIAVFTNLSEDHISPKEHPSMEAKIIQNVQNRIYKCR